MANRNRAALCPSDMRAVEDIVSALGGDPSKIMWQWDDAAGTWRAYENPIPGIWRATLDMETGQWVSR